MSSNLTESGRPRGPFCIIIRGERSFNSGVALSTLTSKVRWPDVVQHRTLCAVRNPAGDVPESKARSLLFSVNVNTGFAEGRPRRRRGGARSRPSPPPAAARATSSSLVPVSQTGTPDGRPFLSASLHLGHGAARNMRTAASRLRTCLPCSF